MQEYTRLLYDNHSLFSQTTNIPWSKNVKQIAWVILSRIAVNSTDIFVFTS